MSDSTANPQRAAKRTEPSADWKADSASLFGRSTLRPCGGGNRFSHSRGEFEQRCAVPRRIFEVKFHALA
jgi:hypothetical protein